MQPTGDGAPAGEESAKAPKKKYVPKGPPPGTAHKGGVKGARKPSKLLRDMRWVYDHPEGEDGTKSQKRLREWFETDRKSFLHQLAALERAQRIGGPKPADDTKGKAAPPAPLGKKARLASPMTESVGPDEGQDRAEGLIEELLEEYESTQKKE